MRYLLFLLVASALWACDKQAVYYTYQALPLQGWMRKDTLAFDVDVPDSQTVYRLFIGIRNRNSYPYQNLDLCIGYGRADKDSVLHSDTLHYTLADREGKWKGKGWGGLYQSEFPAGEVRIDSSGIYRFKIAYTFPDSILPGINDVGIKLSH